MMVLSTISSMYQPTVQASVPQLVQSEQLTQANGIVNSVGALSGLLGPVLGGALYGVFGVKFLIITSCSAFFVSAVMEIYIHIPFVKRPSDVSPVAMILKDTAESYHYLAKNNRVIFKVVMLAAMLNLFLSPLLMIGIPYVLRTTMNSSDMMYGIGLSAMNFAAIMGALLTASTTKKLTIASLYRPLLIAAILIVPMAIAVFPKVLQLGYLPSFLLLIVSVFFVMAISTTLSVFVISDTQKRTSPDMIGKVMGMIMTISQVAVPLGLVLYGFAFEWFHDLPQIPFLIGAVFLLLIALVSKALLKSQANPVV
jgi:MFS family permease